jgi:WD40 repeat protein
MKSGRQVLSVTVPEAIGDGALVHTFTRDGTRLLVSGREGVHLVDALSGQLVSVAKAGEPLRHGDNASSAAMTPEGTRLAAGSTFSRAALWDPSTGRQLQDLTGRYLRARDAHPLVAFTPDGSRLAVSHGREGQTTVWRVPPPGD